MKLAKGVRTWPNLREIGERAGEIKGGVRKTTNLCRNLSNLREIGRIRCDPLCYDALCSRLILRRCGAVADAVALRGRADAAVYVAAGGGPLLKREMDHPVRQPTS